MPIVNGQFELPAGSPVSTDDDCSASLWNSTMEGIRDAINVILGLLDTYLTDTFVGTFTGGTTSPQEVFRFSKIGDQVAIQMNGNGVSFTSNSTSKTITGMPSAIWPSSVVSLPALLIDAGNNQVWGIARIGTTGVITLTPNASEATGWTASGTCVIAPLSLKYKV